MARERSECVSALVDRAPPTIALIVAIAENGVIGRDGDLPWRLSSDLKRFRSLTMGRPVIMGRKTFASLRRPLDGRDNIVVTRDAGFAAEGAIVVHSLAEALAHAEGCARQRGVDDIFVIGGAAIFRDALPLAKRIYLTRVHAAPQGDVIFPDVDWTAWRITHTEFHPDGPKDAFPFTFSVLEHP
jgi:dihydrofolate reductase